VGDRWFDSVKGKQVEWVYDGDSYQWVEFAASGFLGQTGYTGSIGPAGGYTGSVGYVGSAGYVGSTGFVGSTGAGYVGSVGYAGSMGNMGPIGYTGSIGYVGSASTAPGYTGSTSTVPGYTGSVGYAGSSSTAPGYSGSIGYTGSVGAGYTGSTGYIGSTGFTGSGYTGSAGLGIFNFAETAPANPQVGDRWFDAVLGKQVEWIYDGESYQWVEFAASGFLGGIGYTGSFGYIGSTGYVGSKGESTFTTSATAPTSPVVGDRWFDTELGKSLVYVYDGDSYQWIEPTSSGFLGQTGYVGSIGYTGSMGTGYTGSASPAAIVSDTAPGSPVSGTLWFNSVKLNTYVYYNDGTNSQWINTNPGNALPNQAGQNGKVLASNGLSAYWTEQPGGSGASQQVIVGNTTPSTVVPGSLWLDSEDLKLSAYLGGNWLDVSGPAGYTGSAGPAGGYTGSVGAGYTGSVGFVGSAGFNSVLTIGSGLTGSSYNGTGPVTIAIDPTVAITLTSTQTLTNKTITGLGSTSTINDGVSSAYAIGYKGLPQSATTTGNLVITDAGKHIYTSSGVTVPPNSTAAFDIGTIITIINSSTSLITITQGVGVTLRQANSTSTGNRVLAAFGMCSVIKVATDMWYISGNGVG
jgi:hypothetical protein